MENGKGKSEPRQLGRCCLCAISNSGAFGPPRWLCVERNWPRSRRSIPPRPVANVAVLSTTLQEPRCSCEYYYYFFIILRYNICKANSNPVFPLRPCLAVYPLQAFWTLIGFSFLAFFFLSFLLWHTRCPKCNFVCGRDENASRNILLKYLSQDSVGDQGLVEPLPESDRVALRPAPM